MPGSNHGGGRPGAGRPSNQEKHQEVIASFTALAARGLSQCYDNLCTLADGGFERTETKWMPAGLVTRKEAAKGPDGEALLNRAGNPMLIDVLAFPDLPADELVAVEKKVITLAPDFRANEYLVNRVMGVPRPAAEPTPESLDLRKALELTQQALKAYIDPDELPDEDEQAEAYHGA
jgi:hypothetical protein